MSCYGKKARNKTVNPLSKKVPKNPRYDHVKSSIDTGSSITKYMAKIDEIKENYKFRKDEIFKRMKVTTFAQLALQIYRTSQMENLDYQDSLYDDDNDATPRNHDNDSVCMSAGGDADLPTTPARGAGGDGGRRSSSPVPSLAVTDGDYGIQGMDTQRSTLQSVIKGYGQYDITHPPDNYVIPAPNNCPYLLLDVRDTDDYLRCSIITALSYPKANLSKAVNYETKEMLEFKNKQGKVIIIYDEDERLAHSSSTTLVQRGYDNLFMLSGGLKVAYKFFPEGLLYGRPPASICPAPVRGGHRGLNGSLSDSVSTSSSSLSAKRSGRGGGVGGVGGSNVDVGVTGEMDDCRRLGFTTADIDAIDELLDAALLKRNVNSSRMSDISSNGSRTSIRSSASNMSIRSSVSNSIPSTAPIGRPAFKP